MEEESLGESLFRAVFGDAVEIPEVERPLGGLPELFGLTDFERDLGVPEGFLERLIEGDDWSFVIRAHALLESALAHVLSEGLHREELRDLFARIEISNHQTGKIAFARALSLVDKDTIRFIQFLSQLRNHFVHEVAHVGTTIDSFLAGLKPSERKGYDLAFQWGWKEGQRFQLNLSDNQYDVNAVLRSFIVATYPHATKMSLWLGLLYCLSRLYRHVALAQLERKELKSLRGIIDRILAPREGKADGGSA